MKNTEAKKNLKALVVEKQKEVVKPKIQLEKQKNVQNNMKKKEKDLTGQVEAGKDKLQATIDVSKKNNMEAKKNRMEKLDYKKVTTGSIEEKNENYNKFNEKLAIQKKLIMEEYLIKNSKRYNDIRSKADELKKQAEKVGDPIKKQQLQDVALSMEKSIEKQKKRVSRDITQMSPKELAQLHKDGKLDNTDISMLQEKCHRQIEEAKTKGNPELVVLWQNRLNGVVGARANRDDPKLLDELDKETMKAEMAYKFMEGRKENVPLTLHEQDIMKKALNGKAMPYEMAILPEHSQIALINNKNVNEDVRQVMTGIYAGNEKAYGDSLKVLAEGSLALATAGIGNIELQGVKGIAEVAGKEVVEETLEYGGKKVLEQGAEELVEATGKEVAKGLGKKIGVKDLGNGYFEEIFENGVKKTIKAVKDLGNGYFEV